MHSKTSGIFDIAKSNNLECIYYIIYLLDLCLIYEIKIYHATNDKFHNLRKANLSFQQLMFR